MGNSQTTLAELKTAAEPLKNKKLLPNERKNQFKKTFLEKYDEVLNKQLLHVFRKTNEEYGRAHDHKALRIINGELVNLRLDLLNGQADGIKVSVDEGSMPLYIWFQPDSVAGKIIFKTVCGERRKRLRYKLEQITHDFLVNLIGKIFIPVRGLTTP